MTHWVIRQYKGKIYAGVDRLASGPDYPSELSGSGTMPHTHDMLEVEKYVEFSKENKSCVICCAGKTYPQNKITGKNKNIVDILKEEVLPQIDFTKCQFATDLMKAVSFLLNQSYIVDTSKHSLFLGCGFSGSASPQLTIAYYDSRSVHAIKGVMTGYLNSSHQEQGSPLSSSLGSATGYDPVEFSISEEIAEESRRRPNQVGRNSDIVSISIKASSRHTKQVLFNDNETNNNPPVNLENPNEGYAPPTQNNCGCG